MLLSDTWGTLISEIYMLTLFIQNGYTFGSSLEFQFHIDFGRIPKLSELNRRFTLTMTDNDLKCKIFINSCHIAQSAHNP